MKREVYADSKSVTKSSGLTRKRFRLDWYSLEELPSDDGLY